MRNISKPLATLAIFSALITAANAEVSDKVLNVGFEQNGKAAGRLLPTNEFKVVKTEGSRVLLSISGFLNPAAPNVLYASDGQRVIAAAFGKSTVLELKNPIKGQNGGWDKGTIEVWADKADFAPDNKAMMARAAQTYSESCGVCHALHDIKHFTANQWPATFNSMVERTAIDKEDRWLVIQYLQKNSKDYKETK